MSLELKTRYQMWTWRPGGRKVRKWEAARLWAERMNEIMNTLPQEQQDQLDARLRDRLGLG